MKLHESIIHPDLEWVAKNLKEWHSDRSRLCVLDPIGGTVTPRFPMHCIPADNVFTYQQWIAARAELKGSAKRRCKPRLAPAQPKYWDWRAVSRQINRSKRS